VVDWDRLLIYCTFRCTEGSNPLLSAIGRFPVFIYVNNTWEYNRKKIEFNVSQKLVDELNTLGADGWEIIWYEEYKPKKFGGNHESIIIVKRLKPA
jgi:hypothetical protein